MMKNATIIHVDTKVGFLTDRQLGIDLSPAGPAESLGYVWKRVHLRGWGQRD